MPSGSTGCREILELTAERKLAIVALDNNTLLGQELLHGRQQSLLIAPERGDKLLDRASSASKFLDHPLLDISTRALQGTTAREAVVADAARFGFLVAEVALDNATATLVVVVGVV